MRTTPGGTCLVAIGSRATDGYETTTATGPVRVVQFPGGRARVHLVHAARVVDAKRATEAEVAWEAPVLPIRSRVLQLTGGESPPDRPAA